MPSAESLAAEARGYVLERHGWPKTAVSVLVKLDRLGSLSSVAVQLEGRLPNAADSLPSPAAVTAGPPRHRNVSDECLTEIVSLLVQNGERMTATQVIAGLDLAGKRFADSTVRHTLAYFVKPEVGLLTNRPDAEPRGYGLPDWD